MQELDQMTPKLSRPGRSLMVALGFGRSGVAIGRKATPTAKDACKPSRCPRFRQGSNAQSERQQLAPTCLSEAFVEHFEAQWPSWPRPGLARVASTSTAGSAIERLYAIAIEGEPLSYSVAFP